MTSPVGLARPMLASPPPFPERPMQAHAEAPLGARQDVAPGGARQDGTPGGARQDGAPPIAPNPSLRIEPTLGVVVFEVRDGAGEVTRSVPTERELRAYRTAALRGEDAPDIAARATGAPDQTRSPPGGSPSSASALDVPAEGAPKAPADSEARLIK
ncbi:hypothetical protein [Roseococcus thiosulfatophilus]|uniref:hypothetical protein n=1 Tax=Roseococcus thiosulfatophilus TaxID=35813 RepID=UPI001A907302|nr:hypothetical protein [Roseococcus thiosulfatophilus]